MFIYLFRVFQYFLYRLRAVNAHGIHSPFVFEFYNAVLKDKRDNKTLPATQIRKALLKDKTKIEIQDFGAGYYGKEKPVVLKSIGYVARSSARSGKEGRMLYRLSAFLKPQQILELGSNLGLSAIYLKIGNSEAKFTGIEGSPALAKLCEINMRKAGIQSGYQFIAEEFDAALNNINWKEYTPDLVFIDGNHKYEPTLRYFKLLSAKVKPGSCIVLDDIYWSEGMAKAWKEICSHPECTVTIDAYHLGFCFINKNQAKEHFILKT